jgi:hypothetical protein
MVMNGAQLLAGLSEFVNDYEASTTTSAGNSGGTTLVDTYASRYGDGYLSGMFIRITSGTSVNQIRRVTSNTQATGTITVAPAFSAQVATSVTYQIHKYDPQLKFRALDKARFDVIDNVYQLIYDDTVTSDGQSDVYDVPPTINIGPILAISEEPLGYDANWNFITNPQGNSTTGWTASSVTATTYDRNDNDRVVPKYDESCTKLVIATATAGTYSQTVANMNHNVTASMAAGRDLTFAAWVYSRVADKVRLSIADDNDTLFSNYHLGLGWQLLAVEKTIVQNNATTLTVAFNVANTTGQLTMYWNRAWCYFGAKERVTDAIFNQEHAIDIRRDDATQHIILASIPPRGYQIRLVGKAPLSELGTTLATQDSGYMEVGADNAELLYARAAELIFQWERINTDNQEEVTNRIRMVRERQPKLKQNWAQETPRKRVRSVYSA